MDDKIYYFFGFIFIICRVFMDCELVWDISYVKSDCFVW